jgi:LDH2 family malate/lactate/ureidoglycolate dehydrogenase
VPEFTRKVAEFINYVKSCPRVAGCDEIYFPGEIEANEREKRLRDGVFVEPETWNLILETAGKLNARIEAQGS